MPPNFGRRALQQRFRAWFIDARNKTTEVDIIRDYVDAAKADGFLRTAYII